MIETFLSWYKARMHRILDPEVFSLMSSCVREPWELLKDVHGSPDTETFDKYFWTPNAYGHKILLERISQRYAAPQDRILLTQGATSAIFLICSTFLSSGDHVVTERPGYEPLFQSPMACGATVDWLPRVPGKPVTSKTVESCVRSNTKLIFLTDLHNPTGSRMSEDEITGILESARAIAPDVKVVVDEIYLDFNPERRQPSALIDDSIITVSSLTKVYGLSILRCGWIIASQRILLPLRDRQVLLSGIGSRYMESISVQVFDQLDKFWDHSNSFVQLNRTIFKEEINPLLASGKLSGIIPDHGCVSFLKLKGVHDTMSFTEYIDKEFNVLCVPGCFFGCPDHLRIGIGEIEPHKLTEALHRFKEAIATYPGIDR